MNFIDRFLNNITTYRLTLYYLLGLVCAAVVLSFFHLIPQNPVAIIFSSTLFVAVCFLINKVCAWICKAPTNVESTFITALILSLIIEPVFPSNVQGAALLVFVATVAVVSKYLLAVHRRHIFNPAAFGAAAALLVGGGASWWVGGNVPLLFFVLIGGTSCGAQSPAL